MRASSCRQVPRTGVISRCGAHFKSMKLTLSATNEGLLSLHRQGKMGHFYWVAYVGHTYTSLPSSGQALLQAGLRNQLGMQQLSS